jgi:hypothetical protein
MREFHTQPEGLQERRDTFFVLGSREDGGLTAWYGYVATLEEADELARKLVEDGLVEATCVIPTALAYGLSHPSRLASCPRPALAQPRQ